MPVLVELNPEPETLVVQEEIIPIVHEESVSEEVIAIEQEAPVVFELDLGMVEEEVVDTVAVEEPPVFHQEEPKLEMEEEKTEKPAIAVTGFLVKPSVIYVEETSEEPVSVQEPVQEPVQESIPAIATEIVSFEKEPENGVPDSIELVFHEEEQMETEELKEEIVMETITMDTPSVFDEAEAQKARAAERLHKLRNLSFNFNSSDPNNEYENIPAYVRQNLQVHNTTLASVEKFYSSYAVGTDENNVAQISTINTFLEGKKPD